MAFFGLALADLAAVCRGFFASAAGLLVSAAAGATATGLWVAITGALMVVAGVMGVGCGRAGGDHVGQGFGHVDVLEVVLAGEDGFAGFDAGGGCKIGRDAPAQGGEGIAHGAAELQGGAFGVGAGQ